MARIKKTDEEIRAEIIEAANALFIKYGYIKTTMEDIAAAVRKGKSTLYYYYKSKEDVFLDVISNIASSILLLLHEKVNNLSSASERLMGYFEVLTNDIIKVTNLYRLILDELKDNVFLNNQVNVLFFDKDVLFVESILKYGIERKEFQSIKMEDINQIARLIILINRNLIFTYLIPNKLDEWMKSTKIMSNILLKGIR